MIYGLSLFSGIGGIDVALSEYVIPIIYCEIEPYCQSVLLQRMSEGNLSKAPIWDDIRTLRDALFDSGLVYSQVDIVYGGFPCQDISVAGLQKGLEGKRSGLFFEILRIVDETKPSFVFLENVPNIRTKGAERVCKELSERGYDCRWCNISARDVGANHKRERWFLLGYSKHNGLDATEKRRIIKETICDDKKRTNEASELERTGTSSMLANFSGEGLERQCKPVRIQETYSDFMHSSWWKVEPPVGRMVDGLPFRVDRIKALGNAVVPLQVKTAFEFLMGLK